MGRYLRHEECPDCGSSDGRAVYDDDSKFCFVCRKSTKEEPRELAYVRKDDKNLAPITGVFKSMDDRGISHATAEKYSVFVPQDTFYKWGYPLFRSGQHVANKYRLSGDKKNFSVDGEFNKSELFGQTVFPPGSARTLTLCEGYDDAMAAFEMSGSKYPCVSVHSASSARKDCADNFEYLNSFDTIVICFDKDEAKVLPDGSKVYPGQDAAKACAQLFPAKKVRILTLSLAKDANDYHRAGLKREFQAEWWAAPTWTPDGLVLGTDLWQDIEKNDDTESVEYPFEGLNEKTYGMRLGELVVITANTGVGKTSILKEIEYYLLNHTQYGVGILHLEETKKTTALGIMSLEANLPLHLPDVRQKVTTDELRKYYDKTVNTDRIIIYDHFGSNAIDDLLAKIRHMAAMGAKFIILDHLSIVVSDQNGDERKQLDEISTKLKTLTIELNICVIAVVHQNRQGQIRGTAGVEQLANIVFKLSRELEADDPWRQNITKIVVQKNRFCGRTGPACYLEYDVETGRLRELDRSAVQQYEAGIDSRSELIREF